MEDKNRHERLELNQDLKVTRRTWRFERIGWIGLGAFVAAALAGLLGPGPLSEASAGEPGGPLQVHYERFAHFEAESDLRIDVRPPAGRSEVEVWLASDYLGSLDVRGVTPPPVGTRLEKGRVVYRFASAGEGPLEVRFDILYRRIGRLSGEAGLVGGASAVFAHWVYP